MRSCTGQGSWNSGSWFHTCRDGNLYHGRNRAEEQHCVGTPCKQNKLRLPSLSYPEFWSISLGTSLRKYPDYKLVTSTVPAYIVENQTYASPCYLSPFPTKPENLRFVDSANLDQKTSELVEGCSNGHHLIRSRYKHLYIKKKKKSQRFPYFN